MAVLLGIDEAGFGPLLGPLVVSSSTFFVREEHIKSNLWRILRRSVGKKRKGLAGRLHVADSKKAYSRKKGLNSLGRTVLCFLKCAGQEPSTLGSLLGYLCPELIERIEQYPWYQDCGDYAIVSDEGDISIALGVLKDDMASNGMEFRELKSSCLDVGYYNRKVTSVRNKSSVLFTETCRLIQRAFEKFRGQQLQVLIDRQGGRVHYAKVLLTMFGDMELKILKETKNNSSYELRLGRDVMRLHFVVGADDQFLPVSLASMVSKYVRELLLFHINRYFRGFYSELRPTAGYWQDGLRFIKDLKKNIPKIEQMDMNQLVRCR